MFFSIPITLNPAKTTRVRASCDRRDKALNDRGSGGWLRLKHHVWRLDHLCLNRGVAFS
jgi:hypothetical protein